MITVLLPAGQIPDDSKVRKVTGQKVYTLKREVRIYGEGGTTVKCEGVVYLCAEGSVNGVKDTTMLAMDMTDDELYDLLESRRSHQ